jgi:hypothetical protein
MKDEYRKADPVGVLILVVIVIAVIAVGIILTGVME